MVVFNLAYTAPINREGQTPVLTRDQVWAGLERKVTHANEFVPMITSCTVHSTVPATDDSGETEITRTVYFASGKGSTKADGEPVREVCRLFPPARVDFIQDDGSKISNYIGQGPSGKPEDLYMTYVFERRHPGVEKGSEEAEKWETAHKTTARVAVESSIETIRKMASEGKI